LGKLRPLLEKDLKDLLRDPRIYIGLVAPLVVMLVVGYAFSMAAGVGVEIAKGPVALLDLDDTPTSRNLTEFFSAFGLEVRRVEEIDVQRALRKAREAGLVTLVVIPKGFSENITGLRRANVEVHVIIETVGTIFGGAHVGLANALRAYSTMLSDQLISAAVQADPEFVRNPVGVSGSVLIGGTLIPVDLAALATFLMPRLIVIPMIPLIIAFSVVHIAATTAAIENEERTLETLLTFPVSRYDILLSKLLTSAVVALIQSFFFAIGFYMYTLMIMQPGVPGVGAEIPPPPLSFYVFLFASLLPAILFVAAIGIVIGALSNDVRIADSLVGVVTLPMLFAAMIIVYSGGNVEVLPLAAQAFIYVFPTSYPAIIALKAITGAVPVEVPIGIAYSVLLTLFMLFLTSKLMAPEKLLSLQHRIRVLRMRKARAEAA